MSSTSKPNFLPKLAAYWCYCGFLLFLFVSLLSHSAHANEWQRLPQDGMSIRSLSDAPSAVALARDARVLAVALRDLHGVAWYNPDSGEELGRLTLPAMPTAIALNPAGTVAYVLLQDRAEVHVLDLITKRISTTWWIGGKPIALSLAANGQELVVAEGLQGRLLGVDTASGAILTAKYGSYGKVLNKRPLQIAHGLADNAGIEKLLVGAADGVLIILNANTLAEIGRVNVGDEIRSVGAWSSGGQVLAVTKRHDALKLVDPANPATSNSINVDGNPEHLGVDNAHNLAYVATSHDVSISQIDLSERKINGRFNLPDRVGGMVFDASTQSLLVAQPFGERLLRLILISHTTILQLTMLRTSSSPFLSATKF